MNRLSPSLSFAGLFGISLVLWFRPLVDTFALAAGDDRYTHILLILPVAIVLVVQGWKVQGWRGRSAEAQLWTPAAGLPILSLLIAGLARWGNFGWSSDLRLAMEMLGLVIWWIASFALCFGLSVLRSFRFPFFLLLGMVPIPNFALERIVAGLQRGSTIAAQLLFSICMVPVSREGMILSIPGLELDVAPECSSIRSSLMLIVTTMVLAHLFLRSPWRKLLLVLLAIPLSVAKNGLRIFTIGILGTRVDPSFLTGRLHRNGGIVFFLIALAIVFFLLWILRRGERAAASRPQLSSAAP